MNSTVPSDGRSNPSRRALLALVMLVVVSVPALLALQAGGASGSSWEVFNSSGTSTGMVTSQASEGGGFSWTYYVWAPGENPPYTKAGNGTATETGPLNYDWESSNGNDSGTVTIDTDGQSGTWTNNTTGATGTIERL